MSSAQAITYRYELRRSVAGGILESAVATFLLLIAVRSFQAGALSKGLLAGGASGGLLLTPLVVSFVARNRWPVALAAAELSVIAGFSFLVSALFPVLAVFVPACMIATMCTAAAVPLLTHIYQENYPASKRGLLFSKTVMVRIASVAIFSWGAGQLLTVQPDGFPMVLLSFAAAAFYSGYCISRCPSTPLPLHAGEKMWGAWKFVKSDSLFRWTLICWMLMGFGNLMMLPLRVEYLANPKYGMVLPAATVALLTGVIPNVARLCLNPIWGRIFDTANFFVVRIVLNLTFAVGIFTFFTGNSMMGLMIGSIIFGLAVAGGDVAWSLWVTKVAPSAHVAEYMSVHTFLTGVRGLVAPVIAFQLMPIISVQWLAGFATALIVASALMLIPEAFQAHRKRANEGPLVEEISE